MGFSVSKIWPIFGSVFQFLHLKSVLFRVWCLARFSGFLQFSLQFSIFVNNDGFFLGFLCPMHFVIFVTLPRKQQLRSSCKAKHSTLSLKGMDDNPSLFNSPVTAANCKHTMKSLRSYQRERLFLKYHMAWIISLGLDH